MQFDTVSFDEWQAVRELRLYRSAVLHCFATDELKYLADRLVDVHPFLAWWRLLDQFADPADHVPRSITVVDDTEEPLPDLLHVRRLGIQPPQRSLGVGDRRGDRLVDLMGDRGHELAHGGDAVCVRDSVCNSL